MTHMQSFLISTDAADVVTQSSFQCCVSVAAPAVNIIDEYDELNTSLASSSTSHVSSSEDHHVHTCSNPTSTNRSLTSSSIGNCFKYKYVTGFWKTDRIVIPGLFHFSGSANG